MKSLAITALSLSIAGTAAAQAVSELKITRNGSHASISGAAANFTGAVRVDTPFRAEAPGRVSGGHVTFEPAARTAWHTHPLGQTLLVTSGTGRVQRWGGAVQEIKPGDVVWIPPGEKHWHGATPTTAMGHYAITEVLDGKTVEWLEHVTDAQYTSTGVK